MTMGRGPADAKHKYRDKMPFLASIQKNTIVFKKSLRKENSQFLVDLKMQII